MRRATLAVVAVSAVAVVATIAVLAVGSGGGLRGAVTASPEPPSSSAPVSPEETSAVSGTDAVAHAEAFLADWVDDGRVVRRDQGGDTVSEGQAYGLLAAVVARDETTFDEIWDWTRAELVRPDALLAWRWDDGAVVDDEPASDADLDTARALVQAGTLFGREDLTADGVELATALLDELTADTAFGTVLLPGLWATDRDPVPYNPSYASPAAYPILAEATGDARWQELADGSAAVTTAVLETAPLPADWVQLTADGAVEPMPGPFGGGAGVEYGYDAARFALRYAESCTESDLALAGQILPTLSYEETPAARMDLGGGALTEETSPLALAARAASAAATGDASAARTDLAAAAEFADQHPTYYGRAWAMLAAAMLGDTPIGGCGSERGVS
ncbi:glycosyl hydrolase family 8 [Microbacterium sp. NPDC077184]|uniref:glycosyl hydrolase family 8 n=1 Tax=Microbacterium sp. NPDC077184 TaxID=3154764 RepID=UPI003414052C